MENLKCQLSILVHVQVYVCISAYEIGVIYLLCPKSEENDHCSYVHAQGEAQTFTDPI